MRSVCRRFLCAALTGWLVFGVSSSDAQPAVKQVLLLQSFHHGVMVHDYLTGNLQVDLDQLTGRPVNVVQVNVSPAGNVGASDKAIVDYIQSLYADRPKPDLIVTIAGPASVFARKYRRLLFPETPLLLAAVDQRYLGDAPLGENETAVAVNGDFPRGIDQILHMLPLTRQVFMVMGSGPLARFWRVQLEKEFRRFGDRLTFIWSDDLSLADILRRCARLPDHSAIFYLAFGSDAVGGTYADDRVLAELHATANAPMFGVQSVMLGTGIVGGRMIPDEDLSRNIADVAVRILNGASPESVKVPTQQLGPPMFDWRELQRWGIADSVLPPGSVVRYRAPSLWQEHRATVLTAAGALLIQSLLIGGLLYERRARHRAEMENRANLALAADASRRETMSALTSSIAHELGQPLSAVMHNAQALQMMVTANRATSDTIGEILSDIQAQSVRATQIVDRHRSMLRSHQLQKKSIDVRAVIEEGLALVAHDLRARQIESTVSLSSHSCIICGDQVLLQQVLVNLLMNAIDAMADTPPARRRVAIRCDATAGNVEISVRDTGKGLPADVMGTLFKPFVTTKSHGLGIGLTIVRTIVSAHDGTIRALNNPDGGATFTVTLPRSEAPGILSESPADA
jgi:signal transduction histidine kinase